MNSTIGIVILAMIAVFLVLRLGSVLGKRTGFERPEQPQSPQSPPSMGAARPAPVIDGVAVAVPPPPARPLPDPASPVGQVLQAIKRLEPNFDPGRFLDGAEAAFKRIVSAYAAGDRRSLQLLLTESTFAAFSSAITAREAAGEQQISEIKNVLDAVIEQAQLRPGGGGTQIADITVRFVSHQINMVKDSAGQVVSGSDGITEIVDVWGFERVLGTSEPTWRLASAQSA